METTFREFVTFDPCYPSDGPLEAARRLAANWWAKPRKICNFRLVNATTAIFRMVGGRKTYKVECERINSHEMRWNFYSDGVVV